MELQRLLFPPFCLHCKKSLLYPQLRGLCNECRQLAIPPADWRLHPENGVGNLAPMNPVMRSLVHALKYRGFAWVAELIIELVPPPSWSYNSAPVLVPLPLIGRRLRERGYNQSTLLAKGFAKNWGGRVEEKVIRRIRWNSSQTHLDPKRRAINVAGSFVCRDLLEDEKLWPWVIIDDVYTTGATAHACAWALRKAGAVRVEIWTALREEPAGVIDDLRADMQKWWSN